MLLLGSHDPSKNLPLSLYHSPIGLYPFQAELAAFCIVRPSNLLVVDAGLGKSHIALATAAVLIEDDVIDHVLVLCEGNKIDEWVNDFATFTDIPATKYKGDVARRLRMRSRLKTAIVCTYQTFTKDAATFEVLKRGKRASSGPLINVMENKRVLVVMDEMTMIGNRLSTYHMAVERSVEVWGARTLGLTATPITNGMESYYNLGRILCPAAVGTVQSFENDHVVYRNQFHVATKFKDPELMASKMASVMLRKRKTDPDVIDQFPKLSEDFVPIQLNDDHASAYDELAMMAAAIPERQAAYCFRLLQDFANQPQSILVSNSKLADEFIATWGKKNIEQMSCSKSESVIHSLKAIVAQGDQAVVFCDHTSVLDALQADMAKANLPEPALYHGGVSQDQREEYKASFRAGTHKIMLASKAGEKGMNLPEANYIINFDVPLLHSSYVQRYSRGSRIGSNTEGILFVQTFIATGTVEEGAVRTWNNRNQQSDTMIDFDVDLEHDEAFVTAQARFAMIREARRKARETEDEG